MSDTDERYQVIVTAWGAWSHLGLLLAVLATGVTLAGIICLWLSPRAVSLSGLALLAGALIFRQCCDRLDREGSRESANAIDASIEKEAIP
jgi:hypothetical protein